ncbi:hypothetical protein I302_108262 [Kwoniella bestiolae CBS 10118]|uniref:Uncharacterized protein n=1 Tax=Kwoniella bestiolae CBS 10118 TaxID=1296100 RepID=A0AAJ8MCT7_9TREE
MPPGLLSLSDDILHRIGYYLHQDNFIPLPSFHPHYANYASDIDPEVIADYLALRSTCSRMRSVLELKGIHVRLAKWSKLIKWITDGPDTVKRGVRRMSINISPKSGQSLIPTWLTLAGFFESLFSLDELVIINTPLCRPRFHASSGSCLPNYPHPILSNLTSLAVDTNCQACAKDLSVLITKYTSKLRHIKTIDSPNLPVILQAISTTSSLASVRTLYIKLFEGTSKVDEVLKVVYENLPQVTDLRLSMHNEGEPPVFLPCYVVNNFPSAVDANSVTLGIISMGEAIDIADLPPEALQRDVDQLSNLLALLSRFEDLRFLDCGILVLAGNGHWEKTFPTTTRSQTKRQLIDTLKKWDSHSDLSEMCRDKIKDTAFKHIPRLEGIAMWEIDSSDPGYWNYWNHYTIYRHSAAALTASEKGCSYFVYPNMWTASYIGQRPVGETEDGETSENSEDEE